MKLTSGFARLGFLVAFAPKVFGLPCSDLPPVEVMYVPTDELTLVYDTTGFGSNMPPEDDAKVTNVVLTVKRVEESPGWHRLGDYPNPDDAAVMAINGGGETGKTFIPPTKPLLVKASGDILMEPVDFEEMWNDKGSGSVSHGAFWKPIPKDGYTCLGHVATSGYQKPSTDIVRCVKDAYVAKAKLHQLWNNLAASGYKDGWEWKLEDVFQSENIAGFEGEQFWFQTAAYPNDHPETVVYKQVVWSTSRPARFVNVGTLSVGSRNLDPLGGQQYYPEGDANTLWIGCINGPGFPTPEPTRAPSVAPSLQPSVVSSMLPSLSPSMAPSRDLTPSAAPSSMPSTSPSDVPPARVSTNAEWTGDPLALTDHDKTTTAVSYPSDSCFVDTNDVGYVVIDVGVSNKLISGVTLYLEAGNYCNFFLAGWGDGEAEPMGPPEEPIATVAPEMEAPSGAPTGAPSAAQKTEYDAKLLAKTWDEKSRTCKVCLDDAPEDCDIIYEEKLCEAPNNYCMNNVTNLADGTKLIERFCGSFNQCFKDWYHGASDKDVCQNFDENQYITLDFQCTYCCQEDNCNEDMKPPIETLYEDKRRTLAEVNLSRDMVNVPSTGLKIVFDEPKAYRFLKLWVGKHETSPAVKIFEIEPFYVDAPKTPSPTTLSPTTASPTTVSPTTLSPSTASPTTTSPTTSLPTTLSPSTGEGADEGGDYGDVTDSGVVEETGEVTFGGDGGDLGDTGDDNSATENGSAIIQETKQKGGGASKSASSGGDPHFVTWSKFKYDFHGECDLLLLECSNFANDLGLTIQIRTKIDSWWSFIESAALKIGNETLEVVGGQDGGTYFVNGQAGTPLNTGDHFVLNGFKVNFKQATSKQKLYRVDLGTGGAVGLETFKDFVKVNVKGSHLENSIGMMGHFPSGAMVARDGVTLIESPNDFGLEWQVLATEPSLFHMEGRVKAPSKCILPDTKAAESRKRRRLGESIVSEQEASIACSHAAEEEHEACVYDVLATNDKELAGAY